MDPSLSGLTNAWLGAFVRTQTVQPVPPPLQPGPADNLSDVIEQALRNGGPDSRDPGWVDPTQPGRLVDRLI